MGGPVGRGVCSESQAPPPRSCAARTHALLSHAPGCAGACAGGQPCRGRVHCKGDQGHAAQVGWRGAVPRAAARSLPDPLAHRHRSRLVPASAACAATMSSLRRLRTPHAPTTGHAKLSTCPQASPPPSQGRAPRGAGGRAAAHPPAVAAGGAAAGEDARSREVRACRPAGTGRLRLLGPGAPSGAAPSPACGPPHGCSLSMRPCPPYPPVTRRFHALSAWPRRCCTGSRMCWWAGCPSGGASRSRWAAAGPGPARRACWCSARRLAAPCGAGRAGPKVATHEPGAALPPGAQLSLRRCLGGGCQAGSLAKHPTCLSLGHDRPTGERGAPADRAA